MPQTPDLIRYDEFLRLDLRVATVAQATAHPNADRLLVLQVDLGNQRRQIIAALRGHYQPQELVGRQIIVVANLAPRMMRGLESRGMLLAACPEDPAQVIVLSPERPCPPGTRVC